jgi:hypothetical protein
MPKDSAYLASLSAAQLVRLQWCTEHPPKPRSRDQILQDPVFLDLWDRTRPRHAPVKIFPPYHFHKKACRKLGLEPHPKFTKGIPDSIANEPPLLNAPRSVKTTYELLYNLSQYDQDWGMRKCEISRGLIASQTGLSPRTIDCAMSFLRAHRYILRIWRGRPNPRNERYQHSCYELPYDLDHVMAWRIHGGRPGR